MPTKEEEIKLIETLRTVTSGKIYVEVERARLTHKLAKIQENDGQIAQAAKTMHELQVGAGLPDFSRYNVPKLGKIYQMALKIPNGFKNTKWL
jgi:hypothetical protein